MDRRRYIVGVAGIAAAAGCSSPFATDTDGDGVPDGRDAAPRDARAARRVEGDPPPNVEVSVVDRNDGSVRVAVTHAGGTTFAADNTGRLEVAVDGERVETLALPFAVGDTRRVGGIPADAPVVVVWFPRTNSSEPAVLARTRIETDG